MASSGSLNTTAYDGRCLKFSWSVSTQNIANNTTTIKWTLSGAGASSVGYYKAGNFKVVIDGKTVYSSTTRINLYDGTTVKTGTYTFTHGANGSKTFKASVEAGIYTVAVNCTGSATFTLPTIPRASTILSVAGNKITDTFSVKYSKAVSTYNDTLQIAVKGKTVSQTIANYSSGTGFSLSNALKKDIYSVSQSSQSATLVFQLATYNGTSKVGMSDSITKSVTVNNSQPSIGGISYADTNAKTLAITSDATKIIRGYSTLQITLTGIKAVNGATVSEITCTIGDTTKTTTYTGTVITSAVINFGVVNVSGDTPLNVTVKDSRGSTAQTSIMVTVCDYEKPTAAITCKRKENYYTDTLLTVNPTISDIFGKNVATIAAQYKQAGASSWSGTAAVTPYQTTTLSLDKAKAWDVKVTVTDKLNSVSYSVFVEKGQPIIFFDRAKSSVGVNCFPSGNNALEVNGKDIYKALYYTTGEMVTIKNVYAAGVVTGGGTALDFSISLPKSLANIKAISISELKINSRHADGGYTLSSAFINEGYDVLADSNITVTYSISTGINAVALYLDTKSKYNGTNNTPQVVQINSIKFTCN